MATIARYQTTDGSILDTHNDVVSSPVARLLRGQAWMVIPDGKAGDTGQIDLATKQYADFPPAADSAPDSPSA